MKRQSDERFVIILFEPEIKHSEQLAPVVLVVPNSHRAIFMATGGEQWSLQAHIHPRDWVVVESLIKVFKEYIFILLLLCDVGHLRHQLIKKDCGYIIICEGDGQQIFLPINGDSCHSRCSLLGCRPLPD